MYEMSQRHPVWVTENHVNPCNSVGAVSPDLERNKLPGASQQMLLMMFHYKA